MIPHVDQKLTPEIQAIRAENEKLIIAFRNTFCATDAGRDTWEFLHKQLGTFEAYEAPTPEQVTLQQFGMKMLEFAGINYEVNLHEVVNILWKVRPSFETIKILERDKRGNNG